MLRVFQDNIVEPYSVSFPQVLQAFDQVFQTLVELEITALVVGLGPDTGMRGQEKWVDIVTHQVL